ncbi:bcl-2-interacting killer [Carlito syrichta]|uniref:Bcl-2-interacting killer n=1 Tax=Carlito syrichta TaxID=1868482 RepID=A0A1U7TNR6_CARSF|nr:bcl-2-interacting killer [Carlito syrichta]
MSEARPISRDPFSETLLYEQLREPLTVEVLGLTHSGEDPDPEEDPDPVEDFGLMECIEGSDEVALRLACIGDEMDLCLRSSRLAQLPEMAMHSLGLALTYDQTDIRGVLRSFADGFTHLRENVVRFWRSLVPGPWVSPGQACEQVLLLVLLLGLLLGGGLHLMLK